MTGDQEARRRRLPDVDLARREVRGAVQAESRSLPGWPVGPRSLIARNGNSTPVSLWVAMLTEALLTLGLVSVILGTASRNRNVGINGAIAVGAYIALVSVWGAPVSRASMNPRSLAPELINLPDF